MADLVSLTAFAIYTLIATIFWLMYKIGVFTGKSMKDIEELRKITNSINNINEEIKKRNLQKKKVRDKK